MGINLFRMYKNSGQQREIKDVFYLILLQGLNYVAPLLVLPYLMIKLGAEKFGYIGFSLSVCQYLMLIVDFGFNLSGTKRIALVQDNQDKLNLIFSSTFYAKLGLLLLSFIFLTILAMIPQFAIYRSTMFVLFISVIGNTFLFVFLFQGLGKIRVVSVINTISKLSILPLTFWLVKGPADYLTAAFIQSMVSIMAAVLSLLVIFHNKWVTLVRFNITAISTEIREGLPLFLSFAATSIYTACFVVILGLTASPTEVGCYSATDRIMRAFLCLSLTPILQSFYPKISRMGKENQAEALSLVHKLFVFVICAMLILGICLFSCSFWIINLLGIGYKGTENLFRIMAFIPIFVGIGGVIGQLKLLALGNSNDKKHFESAYFIACVVAILGVSLLSALFKAEGTAIALLATEITVATVMVMFDLKRA